MNTEDVSGGITNAYIGGVVGTHQLGKHSTFCRAVAHTGHRKLTKTAVSAVAGRAWQTLACWKQCRWIQYAPSFIFVS